VDSDDCSDRPVTLSTLAPSTTKVIRFRAGRLFPVGSDKGTHGARERALNGNARPSPCENRTGRPDWAPIVEVGADKEIEMRHAIRIQPYLSRDLFQKLRAYARRVRKR
jgi:hypothetical protein